VRGIALTAGLALIGAGLALGLPGGVGQALGSAAQTTVCAVVLGAGLLLSLQGSAHIGLRRR
jgi:hypothetical protein